MDTAVFTVFSALIYVVFSPMIAIFGLYFYHDGLMMSAIGAALMCVTLTVWVASMIYAATQQKLREEIESRGQEYRSAVNDRSFSLARLIFKESWKFAVYPSLSGTHAYLNRIALFLGPIATLLVVGGIYV